MQNQARRVPSDARLLGTVFDTTDFPIAVQMRNLYQACLDQLLQDEGIKFHLVMRPLEPGDHYILQAGDDEELDQLIEQSAGAKVADDDVIVILCHSFLTNPKTKPEMMKIAIHDLTDLVQDSYPIAEPAAGAIGCTLSWITVSGILSKLVTIKDSEAADQTFQELRAAGASMIGNGTIAKIGLATRNPTYHSEILDHLCDEIENSNGCYLSLPICILDVVDASRTLLSRVLDERVS